MDPVYVINIAGLIIAVMTAVGMISTVLILAWRNRKVDKIDQMDLVLSICMLMIIVALTAMVIYRLIGDKLIE